MFGTLHAAVADRFSINHSSEMPQITQKNMPSRSRQEVCHWGRPQHYHWCEIWQHISIAIQIDIRNSN